MAGDSIRVNTDQVNEIADDLEHLNQKLREELEKGRKALKGLSQYWEGEAAQETISSFDEFANEYFQDYEKIIAQYVGFLRTNVAAGYFDTETSNISLADAFK